MLTGLSFLSTEASGDHRVADLMLFNLIVDIFKCDMKTGGKHYFQIHSYFDYQGISRHIK